MENLKKALLYILLPITAIIYILTCIFKGKTTEIHKTVTDTEKLDEKIKNEVDTINKQLNVSEDNIYWYQKKGGNS